MFQKTSLLSNHKLAFEFDEGKVTILLGKRNEKTNLFEPVETTVWRRHPEVKEPIYCGWKTKRLLTNFWEKL
jgi:hypothetical protein